VNPLLWYLLLDIYKKRHQIKPVQAALRERKGKEKERKENTTYLKRLMVSTKMVCFELDSL
jgi:hypothetical protein